MHVDLHLRNILITFDELGDPIAHLIDFGISTRIGQRGRFGYHKDWREKIKRKPWYAAEVYRCGVLDESTDVVALANIIRIVLEKMRNPPLVLKEIAKRGTEVKKEKRPPVSEIMIVLEDLIINYHTEN